VPEHISDQQPMGKQMDEMHLLFRLFETSRYLMFNNIIDMTVLTLLNEN